MLEPNLQEQQLLADTLDRNRERMTPREVRTAIALAGGFALSVAALWLVSPPRAAPLGATALCMLVLALATRVRFDTPFGYTVPTQLGFVPLLFTLPAALVPVAVLLSLAAARIVDIAVGRVPVTRLLHAVDNSWFALGPSAVFALAQVQPRHAAAGLLLLALLAQFATDFGASSLRCRLAREAPLVVQLRETWVYGVDAALAAVGLVVAEQMHATPAAVLSVVPLLGLLALFAHERHYRLQSLLELNNAYRGTALLLGDVVEADDTYTGQHCKSLMQLATQVADEMGLDAAQRRNLEFGALLHDVGKIAIPKEIVNKPGALDDEEWRIIKTHTIEGQRMLERIGGFMREVGLIVRSHHERWDGGGYPDGLAAEAIPLEARIVTCCDTWNAMRTDRPYRNALAHHVALAELRAVSGTQLDPGVVHALARVVEREAQAQPAPAAPVSPRRIGALVRS